MSADYKPQESETKTEIKTADGAERLAPGRVFQPKVDIFEDEGKIVLVADLPGVDAQNLDVTVEKNVLTLRGHVRPAAREGLSPVYAEYEEGDFERAFQVAADVDQGAIRAEMKNGVLTLTLPKERPQTRKIAVAPSA